MHSPSSSEVAILVDEEAAEFGAGRGRGGEPISPPSGAQRECQKKQTTTQTNAQNIPSCAIRQDWNRELLLNMTFTHQPACSPDLLLSVTLVCVQQGRVPVHAARPTDSLSCTVRAKKVA